MATTSGAAPLVTKLAVEVSASGAAVDASFVARAPYAGIVTGVTFVPVSTITGAATNNRAIGVVNKGAAGAGSTSVASITYASGVNASAFDENTVTLSATAANLVVAAGDILSINSTHNGTGIADPGGTVFVEISRD